MTVCPSLANPMPPTLLEFAYKFNGIAFQPVRITIRMEHLDRIWMGLELREVD